MSAAPPKSAPQTVLSDVPPPGILARRTGARLRAEPTLPSLDDEPASQEPTAVASISEAAAREAEELLRAHGSSVPARTERAPVDASLRAVFLLSHVDGRTSIADIAKMAQIPFVQAAKTFVAFAAQGVVDLRRPK